MPPSKRFMELLDTMKDIHIKKNAGYCGDSPDAFKNFRQAELFGISAFQGCLVRMSDKFMRVANLSKNAEADQVGEAITDTLLDLANYAIIAICLYEEEEKIRKENFNEGTVSTGETRLENGNEYFKTALLRRGGNKVG